MARPGDARSPSPTGSHASSRRARKDDNRATRDRRDDGRYRERSPSNSDRRYRERDRDVDRRGYDRRDSRRDDEYRSSRKDRSRDRYRSPDRSDRNRRPRDDRDYRDRRDSRERSRRDREEFGSKNRREEAPAAAGSTPTTAGKSSEEEKIAQRLAKLEAWKQKQTSERERKLQEAGSAGSTRELLKEIDKRAAESPTVASPQSPATPSSIQSPARYTGKFDPKLIAKKAAAASETLKALGQDVALPEAPKESASVVTSAITKPADKVKVTPALSMPNGKPTTLKAKGNLSGFGFGNKQQHESTRVPAKRGLELDDEDTTRKKLERLPTPPLDDGHTNGTAAIAIDIGQDEEDDDDAAMDDAGTEEEAAAAARMAAERREERLLAQADDMVVDTPAVVPNEVTITDAPAAAEAAEEEEEVDPLDAFMDGLDTSKPVKNLGRLSSGVSQKQEPEAIFGDEDDEFSTIETNPNDILEMASKARKKKDIPTVNHAKVTYEPFRKDFYVEPTELADMTEEELIVLRHELDDIKVRGVDVPKPVQKWSQLGLGVSSLDVIQKLGYERPTAIQSQAVPAIMAGRDLIGIAKTGSGKTMGFLLPMWRHIKGQRPLESLDGPIGLILTPTRELATQIHKECRPWLKALDLRAVCAYGGAPIKDQIADLKRGAEVVVCTPGRMIDLLAANSGRVTNLRRVTYIVLDEADRMFDMGFEPQVMKVLANVRPDRQTVLFSATFPRNMESLARKTLIRPVEVLVGGRSVVAPEIKQIVEVRAEDTKFIRLLQLLGEIHLDEDARSLIFVSRQEAAEDLMNAILHRGYPCFTIHGGKDQYDRDSVISDFKAGVFPVLVATSVAARGLDVKQLKLVVNYDVPSHLEDYVHRSGRTGRAGQSGTAVTFITPDQARFSVDIAKALKQSGQDVPEEVQNLVDAFQEQVKAGKEKAAGGSGFGGKGLERLDQERDATRNRERKIYKTGDEPDEEEKEKEDPAEDLIVVKPAGTTSAAPAPTPLSGVPAGIDLDGAIKVHKTEPAAANPADRMKGVSDAVAAINARLRKTGDIRGNAPIDNKGPDAGAFHATLEINDFPQKARWAVTNRTNVAKILESTGTSITTKGNFYAAGAAPPGPTDAPKLYILVEGDTEVVVTNAMRELMRLLKDGTTAAMEGEARAPASGRYNVL